MNPPSGRHGSTKVFGRFGVASCAADDPGVAALRGRRRSIRARAAFVGVTLATLASPVAAATPEGQSRQAGWYEDVAAAAGLGVAHRTRSFENPYARIMEGYTALGAAVAVGDVDGDGLDDLFLTDSSKEGRNLLYRNRGDFTFEEIGEAAGVARGNDAANASADALWLDYDGDGREDLLVVRFGRSQLFRNDTGPGGVAFTEVTAEAGLDRYLNAITAVAFDADRDGDVDLLIGGYFRPVDVFDPDTPRFFPESFETAANGGGLVLFRNDGDGTFADATAEAGLAGHSGWTLDLGHADADLDGDQDLYVACDFGTDRFFVNVSTPGRPRFVDATETAIGIDTKKGMNAEWADFDNDGWFDVYVTNITDEYMREGNFLWKNGGAGPDGPVFADVARETGTWDTGWGWGGKFFDADNDGWLDLYVANGWVSAGPENYVVDVFELILASAGDDAVDLADARNWPPMGEKTLSGYQRNHLFHNQGGALFRDVAAAQGVDSILDARGVAVADLDADGRLDLVVTNSGDVPNLYRNNHPEPGGWIELLLAGAGANPAAIGARVRTTAGGVDHSRFVDGGNGFAAQSMRRLHLGLGAAERVDRLEIEWPSGRRQRLGGLPAGAVYRIAAPVGSGVGEMSP